MAIFSPIAGRDEIISFGDKDSDGFFGDFVATPAPTSLNMLSIGLVNVAGLGCHSRRAA